MVSVTQPQRRLTGGGMSRSPQRTLTQAPKTRSPGVAGGAARVQSQYDWEREIESLDKREVELHQTQMKLIREQMTNFIGDLTGLKDEMHELRLQREAEAVQVQAVHEELHRDKQDMQNELMAVIQALQDGHNGHSAKFDEVAALVGNCMREDQVNQKHAALENRIAQLHSAHGETSQRHSKEFADKDAKHASLQERVDYLESMLGDSADKHAKELAALKAAHEKHSTALSKSTQFIDDHKSAVAGHHATLQERVDEIEQLLGLHADKHGDGLAEAASKLEAMHARISAVDERYARDLDAFKTEKKAHGEHIGKLQRSHESLAAKKEELETSHASMGDRVGYLEKMLGDSVEKHATELRALSDSHSKHANDLNSLQGLHSKHSSVDERLDYLEQCIGDSAEKHAEEVADLRRTHDGLHVRLAGYENHGALLSDLRKSHGNLAAQKAQLETQHASLRERVDYLENLMNDSADKHTESLGASNAKLTEMHTRLAACERFGPSLSELKKGHSDLHEHRASLDSEHSSVKDRLDNIEALFGDSTNRQTKELKALKALHDKHGAMLNKHASQIDGFASHQEHHATLPERVDYIEQQLGDSADKHLADVAELHKKVAREQAAREKHHGSVKELLSREKEERGSHHTSLGERLDYLEGVIGDSAEKHALELAKVVSGHQKLSGELKSRGDSHSAVADRVSKLEKVIRETTERLERDSQSAKARFESFSGRLTAVQEAWTMATPR